MPTISDQMPSTPTEHLWRGPIRSLSHAKRVISRLGWLPMAWGLLICLLIYAGQSDHPRERYPAMPWVLAVFHIAPGVWLLTLRSRTAAAMLLILNALSLALIGTVGLRKTSDVGFLVFIGVCLIVNFTSAIGAWRALLAAFVYQRGGSVSGAEEIAAQFE